ncbi:putative ankyrin repeat protein RF_0381 [Microplitis mediator]|uniref:putative ankyrin repeat protein RF_0381 n=1 Tax=Microplitis mediator TaxID=375433 RepID=UPI002557B1DF|nr:putative ankyrin repeat protein RF_0381 [Microplitis mediator]
MSDAELLEDQLTAAVLTEDVAKLESIINRLYSPGDLSEWMYGYNLLRIAIEARSDRIIDFLLARNVPVNNANEEYRDTPLHLAVVSRNLETVKKLLEKKADINKENQYSKNALDIAISDHYDNGPLRFYNNKTMIEVLVDHVSDNNITDQNYVRLLNHLIDKGHVELSEKLLTKCLHVDLNKAMRIYNFLCESVQKQYLNIVSLLLARGVDVNFIDYRRLGAKTALYIACTNEDEEMVKLLLINGASTDIKNGPYVADTSINYFSTFYYPIHAATKDNDDCKVLELLIDHGADIYKKYVDPRGCQGSALSLAFSYSPKKFIDMLMKKGVDINFKDENGDALISYAVHNQNKEVFEYVLTHQDLNVLDYHNIERILRAAVQLCQVTRVEQVIRYIQQQGSYSFLRYEVDVNLFSDRAHSPILHTTVCGYNSSYLKPLIEYGADVNFLNSRGRTPLHSAFQFRRLESIKNLVKFGADINVICDDGYTPLDYGLQGHLFSNRKRDNPDSNFLSQVNGVKDIVNFFTQHVVKLKLLNLYVNENINDALITRSIYPDNSLMARFANPYRYKKKYEQEIKKMKRVILSDGVTYYDLVTANLVTIIAFLNNDDIFKKLEFESYKTKFPHYWEIISGCFWRGYARKRLLDKVSEHPIFRPIFELPYPCFREIMNYLSNADLKEFLVKSAFYFNI